MALVLTLHVLWKAPIFFTSYLSKQRKGSNVLGREVILLQGCYKVLNVLKSWMDELKHNRYVGRYDNVRPYSQIMLAQRFHHTKHSIITDNYISASVKKMGWGIQHLVYLTIGKTQRLTSSPHQWVFIRLLFANAGQLEGVAFAAKLAHRWRGSWGAFSLKVTVLLGQTVPKHK